MNLPCKPSVLPTGYTGSTYLNNKIQTYGDLALRIKKALGYPGVNVEIADSQLADFIDRAIELYTRYAAVTEEYLVFDSNLYIPGAGIKLDEIFQAGYCFQQDNTMNPNINLLGVGTCTFNTVTAVSTVETYLGSAISYVQAGSTGLTGNKVTITPISTEPWNFDVCDAGKVTVTSISSYEPTILFNKMGMISVSSGDVTVYSGSSYHLPSGCHIPPLTTLWGYDITEANYLSVANIPSCALTQNYITILSNDGNVVKGKICDTVLNSDGYIPADITFLDHKPYSAPVFGEFNLDTNKIFSMTYTTSSCTQAMPEKLPALVEFYSTSTIEFSGLSSLSATDRMDYSLENYRKVASVFSFEAGSFTNTNILFNIDYAIAQRVFGQTSQFTHIQHTGFDLISYEILRQWVDLTNRILAREAYIRFDRKTQMLRIIPEPSPNSRYCAAIGCYMERAIDEVINEKWVFEYATALTKIALGHIRGKFGSIALYGGGTINADIGSQGLTEKDKLEDLLIKGGEGPSVSPFFIN